MGYPRALRHACAFAAIVGLTGCNPPARQSETAELRNNITALQARVSALENRNAQLEADVSAVRAVANAGVADINSLRGTVNNNADVSNRNAIRDMTRRGACGTEARPIYDNSDPPRRVGTTYANKECTLADLTP